MQCETCETKLTEVVEMLAANQRSLTVDHRRVTLGFCFMVIICGIVTTGLVRMQSRGATMEATLLAQRADVAEIRLEMIEAAEIRAAVVR